MGLKILHSADWHLDSPFSQFSADQRSFLQRELLKIPRKIADLCHRENCDLVLLSGDLFDGPYTQKSARELRLWLEECRVPVFISPGNHDSVSPGSPWLEEPWPENVHIFTGGLASVAVLGLDCRVWGAGYHAMDCPGLLENFRAECGEAYSLAVLHGDPLQANSPYCPVSAAQVRESGLDYLALGHIHKAGSFLAGDTLCAWPGSPMGRGFDETEERGAYIVTLGERADLRFVPLDTPRFLNWETDENSLDTQLPGQGDSHFYRITLRGRSGETIEALRERYARLPNLRFIDHREEPRDLWQLAGQDTLEGTYFRLLKEKLEDADPDSARCIRLAAEISDCLLRGGEVEL